MARWTNENAYDPVIRAIVTSVAGVDGPWPIAPAQAFTFIKAIVASESAFNPKAVRGEAHLADASHGLMQLLYSTAKGLGYPEPRPSEGDRQALRGLYDPGTNLYLGARHLRGLLVRFGGDIERAASAYNGGDRPQYALGTRATKAGRLCLQWKPTAPASGRTIDRDCARAYTYKAGEFGNQPYVNKVRHNYDYFFASAAGTPPPTP